MPYGWYPQFPTGYLPALMPPTIHNPVSTQPATSPPVANIPKIAEWLAYCDRHPDRKGNNLVTLTSKFEEEGYCQIHQLTGGNDCFALIEKLSKWLGIGKGMVDLIIQYAEEDLELVKVGRFVMN